MSEQDIFAVIRSMEQLASALGLSVDRQNNSRVRNSQTPKEQGLEMTELSDLEITRKCAEMMGMRDFKYYPPGDYPDQDGTFEQFTDGIYRVSGNPRGGYNRYRYNPLHDDAQAMALVKRFELDIGHTDTTGWYVHPASAAMSMYASSEHFPIGRHADLNRAICLCVARMADVK